MEKFEITKEQVLTIYDATSVNNQDELKQWFPEAFKIELEVGKWYESSNFLIMYKGNNKCISIHKASGNYKDDDFHTDWMHTDCNYIKATEQEVKTALINEAKKRGYKNGNYECLDTPIFTEKDVLDNYFLEENTLWHGRKGCANVVFQNGKWAIIIETITKEEAEKLLNKKIKL